MNVDQDSIDDLLKGAEGTKAAEPPAQPSEAADKGSAVAAALAANPEKARGDVSASTIARMMGVATTLEIKVLEQKVDLLSTKFNSVALKLDKMASALSSAPTGGDLERIDLQIGHLKNMLREVLTIMSDAKDGKGG